MVLLETDRAGNEQRITAQDNGTFRFTLTEPKKSFKFRVILPNLGETNLVVPATDGWLSLKLISKVLVPRAANPLSSLGQLCQAENEGCTLFLFDYLNNDISGDELQAFHNFQAYRLDKAIRDYLSARNLLEGLDFHVQRCATASVKDASLASQAATVLKVPAVMWGFIKRSDNKLISATTFTVLDRQTMSLNTREVLGGDVTELMGVDRPVKGTPLAIATLMIGDVHLKLARPDLARRAYLHAGELAAEVEPRDQADFLKAVNARLQRLNASNPAATLTPIGGTHG